ncbi:hypothetical protein CVT26_002968 [Gymnopilus dilepis]|uniref:CENP-V/GFA domain-containing protein n=1 Tax=Gymnopilus dilepis TaxID=231916 RepID=A0A409VR58_9AGAR|nr:hypothetical protein CVT26_002968 [Gymnopilus dilepis]
MPHTGSCLCGESTIQLESTHNEQVLSKSYTLSYYLHTLRRSTNILVPKSQVKIEGPIKTFDIKAPSGNTVTRIFCGNCGSALSHKSVAFGDSQAIQTGNFRDFAKTASADQQNLSCVVFVKDRWPVLPAIDNAQQCQAMT